MVWKEINRDGYGYGFLDESGLMRENKLKPEAATANSKGGQAKLYVQVPAEPLFSILPYVCAPQILLLSGAGKTGVRASQRGRMGALGAEQERGGRGVAEGWRVQEKT